MRDSEAKETGLAFWEQQRLCHGPQPMIAPGQEPLGADGRIRACLNAENSLGPRLAVTIICLRGRDARRRAEKRWPRR